VTFVPYTCRIYGRTLRVNIGLRACWPPCPDADASYALPVRQAGTLLTAAFRPRLAATPLLFG